MQASPIKIHLEAGLLQSSVTEVIDLLNQVLVLISLEQSIYDFPFIVLDISMILPQIDNRGSWSDYFLADILVILSTYP